MDLTNIIANQPRENRKPATIKLSETLPGDALVIVLDGFGQLDTVVSHGRLLADKDFRALAPKPYPVTHAILKTCLFSEGVLDWHHRIPEEQIDSKPITVFERLNAPTMIAHGNHRYIKAYLVGRETIPARYVPEHIWRRYSVEIDGPYVFDDPKTRVV